MSRTPFWSIAGSVSLLAAGLALPAMAQPAPTAQTVRGKVVSVDADKIVINSHGVPVTVGLAKDWVLAVVTPTTLADIKPGSFVGTTNTDVPDGGVATELHVFPPGSTMNAGQFVMNQATSTRMTNGTVAAATRMTNGTVAAAPASRMTNGGVTSMQAGSSGGMVLDLSFPGGTRHVRVPATATITKFTPEDHAMLKAGYVVAARAQPDASGNLTARFVMTGPDGAAPAR